MYLTYWFKNQLDLFEYDFFAWILFVFDALKFSKNVPFCRVSFAFAKIHKNLRNVSNMMQECLKVNSCEEAYKKLLS